MKKYKFYVCSRYVFYFYASILCVALVFTLLILPSQFKIIEKIIILFIIIFWYIVNLFLIAPGSFSRVYITEEGIGNKYLFFAWAEIASYHLCEIKHPLGLTFPTQFFPMIVCIGDVSSNVFFHCSSKKAVCFSLTKKNLKMIDEMCEEKNETIKELLSWNNFPIKKW
jgi:hypothetical protein